MLKAALPVHARSAADLGPETGQRASTMVPQLKTLYENLHSHPELGS